MMHRPGADPEHMTAEDFLCDFCGLCWAPERPMVEGHRGSLICGSCLSEAFRVVVHRGEGVRLSEGEACTLCLAPKDEPHWRGTTPNKPAACRVCIRRSGAILEKDAESGWTRPQA